MNREDDTMTPQEERAWIEKDQQLNGQKHEAAEWDGKGLPPVGAVCEYFHDKEWMKAEVLAHRNHCAVVWTDDGAYFSCVARKFRPIRTDRDRWIEQAQKTVDKALESNNGESNFLYGAIWDAGLGKLPE